MKAHSAGHGVDGGKYFARYAEPESLLAQEVREQYLAALVVPVCGEEPSLLDGFQAALADAPGRVLFVLVVNATDAAAPAVHAANERLLRHLAASHGTGVPLRHVNVSTPATLARATHYDLLWLDRASAGVRLPDRHGVGSVRKLGCDLAAALWVKGQIGCPRIASSDADVRLPRGYFGALSTEVSERTPSAAWLWPFRHEAGGDLAIHEATVLYEISLRYYVLGLAAAGSTYAYQSIGSTLCVDARAYAAVRGFPKREAGEDFYLLDKLAKFQPLRRPRVSPLAIRSRASERVPFGTGRRSREIAEQGVRGESFVLYNPVSFAVLAALLQGLDDFAVSARVDAVDAALQARAPDYALPARRVLDELGVFTALASAAQQAPPGPVLRRRIHTWFDALRTLRFLHGLRDRCLPSLAWREALTSAAFLEPLAVRGSPPEAICTDLALLEAALPEQVGPALL